MARLNVSLPDDLYRLASRWRGTVNLSEVCARALRLELEAAESHRSARGALSGLRARTPAERALVECFELADAVVTESPELEADLRETLGIEAARYFERTVAEGATVGIAGGRQTWCVVRNLTPRNLGLTLTAIGARQSDPEVLHAHPNTLVTLLSLLYAPRSEAYLVGSPRFDALWKPEAKPAPRTRFVVLASCGPFETPSSLSRLLGAEATYDLNARGAIADFCYAFMSRDGVLEAPSGLEDCSFLGAPRLRDLAGRRDARVILVAGGPHKYSSIERTLAHRLCNTLITDTRTADRLLGNLEDKAT